MARAGQAKHKELVNAMKLEALQRKLAKGE